MSGIEVHDPGDLRKYRTEIPNLIFEMGLSPHALALYGHLKRTCGQSGKCWKATKTLADEASMSAGKVSEARAELEEAKLISVERPKDRTKPVVVTIVDVWPKNFEHFARVQNMNTSRSEYETKKEPLEEGVEANASSAIAQTPEIIGLEKHIVDGIYHAMRDAGFRLPNEHFKYHLGRAKDVLEKDDPSDEEIEGMPAAFVGLWTIKGKADAHSALMEMRRQRARPGVLRTEKANTYGVTPEERERQTDRNTTGYEEIFSVSGGADEPAEPFDKDAMLARMRGVGSKAGERGAA